MHSTEEQQIFGILSGKENIGKMIDASYKGLPSLSVCAAEIEGKYGNTAYLRDNTNRQNIGRMVKEILGEYGYFPVSEKDLSETLKLSLFTKAAVYGR
ncbi:hypothetical protein FACS1894133_4670 [Clostridia bacterium]|nr:hypothetical protein FACS1894133_4670 [Clostridia bacterium]